MNTEFARVRLSPEMIEAFLERQRGRGLGGASLEAYRRSLGKLYDYLPEDKCITPETASAWRKEMEAHGVSPRSINARLSALNGLSGYLGRWDCQNHEFLAQPEVVQPELTRREYLRLLQAAKSLGKERTYLLIKVLGSAGVRVQELPQLTVEAVREGAASFCYHNNRCRRVVRLPQALREELLDFAGREGIWEGPVFQAAGDGPLSRTYVYKLLQAVSPAAQVDGGKATPRCLWNLYQGTRETILNSISLLAEQAYDRLLEEEQRLAGWDGQKLPLEETAAVRAEQDGVPVLGDIES